MANEVSFVSDSTIDLPEPMLVSHRITTVPLRVFMDGTDYRDGLDITAQQLYDYARRTKTLPKTSAAHGTDLYAAFKTLLDQGQDVVYTGISGELSSTFNAARLARDELMKEGYDGARMQLVDSLQLSTGIAQLVLRGYDLAQQDLSAAEIAFDLERFKRRLSTSFVVDTLEYLHIGGRCTSLQYFAGNMLKLHPQINMVDGKLAPGMRYRGSLQHSIKLYFEKVVLAQLDLIDPKRIFVTHTTGRELMLEARSYLEDLHYFENIYDTEAGATIASHCGPGTLGFLFVMKEAI
jgi:DegV family protein with EDD domain